MVLEPTLCTLRIDSGGMSGMISKTKVSHAFLKVQEIGKIGPGCCFMLASPQVFVGSVALASQGLSGQHAAKLEV